MAKIKFDIPSEEQKPISLSFKLQHSEVELIENYTKYLSHIHHKKIEKEIVLRGLLKPLLKDKDYLEFLKVGHTRTGAFSDKKNNKLNLDLKKEAEPIN